MPTINQRRLVASLVAASLVAQVPAAFAAGDARVDSAAADLERTVLTLRGSFAKPGLKVYLGGYANPLAIRSLTGTTLEALLPAGLAPGSYHIVVGDDEAFAITLGPVGPAGDVGAAGVAGIRGATGPRGIDGPMPTITTLAGTPGVAGADGSPGAAGPAGPQGPLGDAGANGSEGLKGPRGNAGPQGARGPAGPAPVVNGPGLWHGPQGPQGMTGYPGTYVQLARWWTNQGTAVAPMGSEATLGVGEVGPLQNLGIPRGDLIVHVDAMAIMTADWFGCELKLRLVVEDLYALNRDFVSLPFYRYLPKDVARHVSYTIAVPDVDRYSYNLRLVGTSDCPGTTLSQVTIGGQWLNRLP